jgi:hypothetical protein
MQTLYFKFTGAPESKFIFSSLGVEPWGRYLTGVIELITCVFLSISKTQVLGAVLASGVMAGAILGHAFVLGLVVQNDGGLLFGLACTVFISSILIIVLRKTRGDHS